MTKKVAGVGALLVASLTACTAPATTSVPPAASPASAAAPTTESSQPTPTPVASPASTPDTPTPTPEPAQPTPTPTPEPPATERSEPLRRAGLSYGQTAQLRYFDITVQRFEHGKDGISAAWRTQTCYRRPHPEAKNGRVPVSTGPWKAVVIDGEGGTKSSAVSVDSIGIDPTWSPLYVSTTLALGECQTGWIAIRHRNPDLQWLGIQYRPADGDQADWS